MAAASSWTLRCQRSRIQNDQHPAQRQEPPLEPDPRRSGQILASRTLMRGSVQDHERQRSRQQAGDGKADNSRPRPYPAGRQHRGKTETHPDQHRTIRWPKPREYPQHAAHQERPPGSRCLAQPHRGEQRPVLQRCRRGRCPRHEPEPAQHVQPNCRDTESKNYGSGPERRLRHQPRAHATEQPERRQQTRQIRQLERRPRCQPSERRGEKRVARRVIVLLRIKIAVPPRYRGGKVTILVGPAVPWNQSMPKAVVKCVGGR